MADVDTDDFSTGLYELEAAIRGGDYARARKLSAELGGRLADFQSVLTTLAHRLAQLVADLGTHEAAQSAMLEPAPSPPAHRPISIDLEQVEFHATVTDEGEVGLTEAHHQLAAPPPVEKSTTRVTSARIRVSSNDVELDLFANERTSEVAESPLEPPPQEETAKGLVYRVWFGTNRKLLDPQKPERGFGLERSRDTTLGHVDVWVPKAHRFGETGTSFFTRLKRLDLRDDHLRVRAVVPQDTATAWRALQAEMQAAKARGDAADALLFLHGYKTSFEEAAIRAAQLGVDLHVPGATAFFSWPSRGKLEAYTADEASIEASESAITAFLCDFTAQCGAQTVHVVAHSMGNRGLLRALQRIAANAETRSRVRFGQIFLAAPDLDRDLFLDLARLYPAHSQRTTLYASDGDLPVQTSARLHGAPRAGYFLPYTVAPDIDTIAVPDFDIDLLGHSYFAQADALLHDMHDLMRHDDPPRKRQRLTPVSHGGLALWCFVR